MTVINFTTEPSIHFTRISQVWEAINEQRTDSLGNFAAKNISVDAQGHLNVHNPSTANVEFSAPLTAGGISDLATIAGVKSPMRNVASYNSRGLFGDLATLINAGLQRAGTTTAPDGSAPEPRRVQLIQRRQQIAAVVSPTYRLVPHGELMTLAPLVESAGLEFYKGELTDGFIDLKFLSPKLVPAVRVGDPVKFGFNLTNSETGLRRLSATGGIFQLQCTNGAVVLRNNKAVFEHNHTSGIDTEALLHAMLAFQSEAEEIVSWLPRLAATPLEPVFGFIEGRLQRIFGKPKAADNNESKAVGVEILDAVKVAPDAYAAYSLITNRAIHVKNRDAGLQLQRLGGDLLEYAGKLGTRPTLIAAATTVDPVSLN